MAEMKRLFIDQVLTGFDLAKPDYGVGEFCEKRRKILEAEDVEHVLEFCEVNVDTYENLVYHHKGRLSPLHRNILIWRHPREPNSLQYWTQEEFARLVQLLKAGGVDRVMVRTFLTFEGRIGHGRFLRNENTQYTHKFEWRRADEFLRRHPEVREPDIHVLNWFDPITPDPLYDIPDGLTVGRWFLRQLFDFFEDLGVDAVRFGDGSFGGIMGSSSRKGQQGTVATLTQIHRDIHDAARGRDIRFVTSLGPYWSFDAWRDDLGVNFHDLDVLADGVITQPLEGWTDRYGITYIHNGEYFNAGAGDTHILVDSVFSPKCRFIRGLDSSDIIENWNPPESLALRETLSALTLWRADGQGFHKPYRGVYHFWSDELSPEYYHIQRQLWDLLHENPAADVAGPRLVVDEAFKPHVYVMGDFFEACGYGLRVATASTDVEPAAGRCYAYFLPRQADDPAVLDETPMPQDQWAVFQSLWESPADVIVFGGSRDEAFCKAFGVQHTEEEFDPIAWRSDERNGEWYDHAAISAHANMAGTPEKYFRKDYLRFVANGADVLAEAIDATGQIRPMATMRVNPAGGRLVLITGLCEQAAAGVAENTLAGRGGLDYTVRAESHANVASARWTTRTGRQLLAIYRTDAFHADPVAMEVTTSAGSLKPLLHSRNEWNAPNLVMSPQSWCLMEIIAK